ncbi:MAG: Crp/Fnr family transcriptional regulator [Planctomycetota bacterium]
MSDDDHKSLLKHSQVFDGLEDDELERVLALAKLQRFSEGQVIVEEDQQARTCYFLTQGRVDIEIRSPFGSRSQRIATIKRGEVFGELSLVDGFLRSATARAVDEVEALAFDNQELEGLMDADPRIGYRIMRNVANVLSSRMRTTNMRLRNALSDLIY